MIGGINPYKLQEMQAGGLGSFGAGQQAGVNATGGFQGAIGGVGTGVNPSENLSLVDRLNQIDASAVRPSIDSSNAIDGYDGDLSVNGLPGVTGESIFVGNPSSVDSTNNFNTLYARLNNMDYEMHPDTRDEFRGNRLYLEG